MSLKFNNPAYRQEPPDYETIVLAEDLIVEHPLGMMVIPEGFVCDLESVPGIIQAIPGFGKIGKGSIPGVIHDYLYRTGMLSKPMADAVYLEAMRQRQVSAFVRYTKYLAVRLFGGKAWADNRANDPK